MSLKFVLRVRYTGWGNHILPCHPMEPDRRSCLSPFPPLFTNQNNQVFPVHKKDSVRIKQKISGTVRTAFSTHPKSHYFLSQITFWSPPGQGSSYPVRNGKSREPFIIWHVLPCKDNLILPSLWTELELMLQLWLLFFSYSNELKQVDVCKCY